MLGQTIASTAHGFGQQMRMRGQMGLNMAGVNGLTMGGVEEWRIIPVGARVYQCSYHRGIDDRELHGPAPCSVKKWKIEIK